MTMTTEQAHDVLAEQLRLEADATKPEFSESLHEQICDATRRADLGPRSVIATIRPWWHRPALAAAVVALVGVGVYRLTSFGEAPVTPKVATGDRPVVTPDPAPKLAVAEPTEVEVAEEVAVVTEQLMDRLPVNLFAVLGDLVDLKEMPQ
jgi:hypothetical protein